MVGTLMSAFLSDLLGRKVTLLLGMAISLAGWVTIYLAKKLPLLLAGRVLQVSQKLYKVYRHLANDAKAKAS